MFKEHSDELGNEKHLNRTLFKVVTKVLLYGLDDLGWMKSRMAQALKRLTPSD